MLHGILISLSGIVCQVCLHVFFDKKVVCGGRALCLPLSCGEDTKYMRMYACMTLTIFRLCVGATGRGLSGGLYGQR